MNIVTGYTSEPHVTSWQDRDLNIGIFGSGNYILNVGSKLAATIVTNNEIRIADGAFVMQGCLGVIQKGTYDTIAIDNGSQGMMRNDLICAQYSKNGSTGVESMSLVVIKGTAAATASDPAYTSGDIQNGDTLVQVPLYRVVLSGLTVTGVELLADVAGTISGGGSVTSMTGTASLSGVYTTVYSEVLAAGTYLASMWVRVEDDIPTLRGWIMSGNIAYGSGAYYAPTQYDTRMGVTALITLASPSTLTFMVAQNSGSTETVSYGITYKKVG